MSQIIKSQQQQLVDIIDTFLSRLNEPMHYKELTQILIESGAWKPYGEKPEQIVYSAIHQDIRRYQEDSTFRIMKGGICCTARLQEINSIPEKLLNPTPLQPKINNPERMRSGENKEDVKKRLGYLKQEPRCGNCEHITFSAVNEYSLKVGECNKYPESDRFCTRPVSLPCPLWSRASVALMEARFKRREDLRLILIKNGYLSVKDSDIQLAKGKK